MTIQQIDDNTYHTVNGASAMTLTREGSKGWQMMTSNPSTRAWNRGPSIKHFQSLQEIEAKYKSWRGVSILITDHATH